MREDICSYLIELVTGALLPVVVAGIIMSIGQPKPARPSVFWRIQINERQYLFDKDGKLIEGK